MRSCYLFLGADVAAAASRVAGRAVGALRIKLLSHPIPWIIVVLSVLTVLWEAIGAPISLITQDRELHMLYGAGVNLLVGYTGLVPFGASVFFGCASYAVAIPMRTIFGNEIEALIAAILFSLVFGDRHRGYHPAPPRAVFLLADSGVFANRVRDRV